MPLPSALASALAGALLPLLLPLLAPDAAVDEADDVEPDAGELDADEGANCRSALIMCCINGEQPWALPAVDVVPPADPLLGVLAASSALASGARVDRPLAGVQPDP